MLKKEKDPIVEELTVEAETEEVQNSVESTFDIVLDLENKARDMGWKPLEEFDGPKDNWKGPGAYVKDSELYASLKSQTNKIKDLELALKDVKIFMSKSEEAGYQRAIAELTAQRKYAIETYDVEALDKVDDRLIELKSKVAAKTAVVTPTIDKPTEVKDFEQRNRDWYNTDTPENMLMMQKAMQLSSALINSLPTLSAAEHIKHVEADMRKLYPEKFTNPRRSEPGVVGESSSKSGKANVGIDLRSVPKEVMDSAERCVRRGIFPSVEAYLKEAKKLGVIK